MPACVEERWVNVCGRRMRYFFGGSGPALILVHGLLGYSFSWRLNYEALTQHATVYAVDQLGTGYSDGAEHLDCGMSSTAARLVEFMDKAGIESADLLGTSHGGAVAITAAAAMPARVRRLVLVAPVNPWSRHGRLLAPLLSSWLGRILVPRLLPPLTPLHYFILARLYGDTHLIPAGTLAGYSAPLLAGGFEHALRILHCWNADLRRLPGAIPRIRHIPTLLIWGDRDPAVWPSSAEPLQRQFERAQLMMMPGVGHLPYEEAPVEFNRALIAYLTGTAASQQLEWTGTSAHSRTS
jgi:pimeloyl-ACP methyl ester carboxylesterase